MRALIVGIWNMKPSEARAWLAARWAEPGTSRSLAIVLFALTGAGNSQAMWESVLYLLAAGLGISSAASTETKTPEAPPRE